MSSLLSHAHKYPAPSNHREEAGTRSSHVITFVVTTLLNVSPTIAGQHEAPQHLIVPLVEDGQVVTRLSGDPNAPGAPYVIRIENVDGQIVLPHWHPEDEHIVVVQGT
jgi:hypothetical protein